MSQPTQLEPTNPTNPLVVLVEKMIEKGTPMDQLEKILDMAERWERNQAADVFAQAITAFQADMGAVTKVRPVKNKAGQLLYYFADFCDVMDVVQPLASKHGIVITFDTGFEDKRLKVTCNIRVGTHVEHAHAYVSVPAIPNANETQMDGGAIAFGKRYAVCAGLGIRIKGEDNDAHMGDPTLTDDQTATINNLLERNRLAGRTEAQLQAVWDWVHKETDTKRRLPEMPPSKFGMLKENLEEWLKKYGKKAGAP